MLEPVVTVALFAQAGLLFAALVVPRGRRAIAGISNGRGAARGGDCGDGDRRRISAGDQWWPAAAGASLGLSLPGSQEEVGLFLYVFFALLLPVVSTTSLRAVIPGLPPVVLMGAAFACAILAGAAFQP